MAAARLPTPADLAAACGATDAEALPATPGAYVLIIELTAPTPVRLRTLSEAVLPPGRYAYAGSARGPGGIRARVRRHMRADKKLHWHIDHLTAAAGVRGAVALPGRRECEAVAALMAAGGATIPVPGFGSSDCADCPAHLLALP